MTAYAQLMESERAIRGPVPRPGGTVRVSGESGGVWPSVRIVLMPVGGTAGVHDAVFWTRTWGRADDFGAKRAHEFRVDYFLVYEDLEPLITGLEEFARGGLWEPVADWCRENADRLPAEFVAAVEALQ